MIFWWWDQYCLRQGLGYDPKVGDEKDKTTGSKEVKALTREGVGGLSKWLVSK